MLPRVPSVIEHRRLGRFAASGYEVGLHGAQGGVSQPMTHHVALKQELTQYRRQRVEADVCGFSLPGVRPRKSYLTLAQGTGEFVMPPYLPHLALLGRLYHEIKVTPP